MIRLAIFTVLILCGSTTHAQNFGIGDEYVEPLRYPKFSVSGVYQFDRKFNGFADDSLRYDLKSKFDTILSFEAGLLKYFNAGALFGAGISGFGQPIQFRFGLFAKPYYGFGDRVAIFGRFAGGLAIEMHMGIPGAARTYYGTLNQINDQRIFKNQVYDGPSYGGFGSATIGIEVFPFSRFGIAIEGGIRGTVLHSSKNWPGVTKNKDLADVPSSFNYLLYEFPLMATLHFIL